ncbi:hypothetical protein [Vacuolonema iberomarrocanum]|uniref:hypothetical protein n=1 Tax=Vacuolonema iberomarrocanum TaxID=3454632 RepID=UPI0019FA74B6|nr:hypothetical protein [filamentous cyanobacterium LEGE 07170]
MTNIPNGFNFSLEVYDSDRRLVRRSSRAGNRDESVNLNVNRGDYFVRVRQIGSTSGSGRYSLTLQSNPDRAGNIREGSRDLNEILDNGTVTVRDFVSRGDRRDFYEFTLAERSVVELTYRSFEQNSNVFFQDGTSPDANETSFRTVQRTLDAGLHALRVVPIPGNGRGVTTRYSLQVDITPDGGDNGPPPDNGPPTDHVGNSFESAKAIAVRSTETTFSDNIGGEDTSDFFRFTTNNAGDLDLGVSGNNRAIQFNLFNGQRQFLRTGTDGLSISDLQSGTYFLQLRPGASGAPSTPYTLSTLLSPIDGVGNNFGSATQITVDATQRTEAEGVGGTDPADFYRFNAGEVGDLQLSLTGASQPLTLTLFNASQNQIGTSTNNSLDVSGLQTGNYFIRVAPSNPGAPFSAYNLRTLLAPDRVGDSEADATLVTDPGTDPFPVIGINPQDYSDFASGNDEDFFRLDLTEDYNFVSLSLEGLSANLNLQFFRQGSDSRVTSNLGGTTVDALEGSVGPGTYFVRVFAPGNSPGSSYNLSMAVDSENVRPSITRDVFPTGDSNARLLTDVTNLSEAFFVATDDVLGLGLFRSQGTLDTTIRVGSFTSITSLEAVGSSVYIAGSRSDTGLELYRWTSDGSPTGQISLVEDINPGTGGSSVRDLIAVGNNLYFRASEEGTPQDAVLYRTNGTTVTQVANVGESPTNFTVVDNSTLYYTVDSTDRGDVLQRISNAGTANPDAPETLGTISGVELAFINNLQAIGDDLFFTSEQFNTTEQRIENLEWRRLSSTDQLSTFDATGDEEDGLTGFTNSIAVADGFVYFVADAGLADGTELFRADLSTAPGGDTVVAVEQLDEIIVGNFGNPNITNLTSYNGSLFFNATDGSGNTLFVVEDADAASTPTAVKVDLPGVAGTGSNPQEFIVANDILYFSATTSTTGREVWSYDGAASPTATGSYTLPLNFEIVDGADGSDPLELTAVGADAQGSGGRIYFTADDGVRGREVWVI